MEKMVSMGPQPESSRKTNPNPVFGTEPRFGTADYYKRMDKKQIFRSLTAEERSSFVPLSSMLGKQSVKATARNTVFTTENRFGPPKKNMSSKCFMRDVNFSSLGSQNLSHRRSAPGTSTALGPRMLVYRPSTSPERHAPGSSKNAFVESLTPAREDHFPPPESSIAHQPLSTKRTNPSFSMGGGSKAAVAFKCDTPAASDITHAVGQSSLLKRNPGANAFGFGQVSTARRGEWRPKGSRDMPHNRPNSVTPGPGAHTYDEAFMHTHKRAVSAGFSRSKRRFP